jgi:subtilisin family serine protease
VHLPNAELWRYVRDSDSTVLLGMKMPGAARGIYGERVLIGEQGKLEAERSILAVPGVKLVSRSSSLPILKLHLANYASLVALRRSPFVDYVEPVMIREPGAGSPALSRIGVGSSSATFDISENGSSCSGLDDWSGDAQDQVSVLGDVIGWSQGFHYTRVAEAWGRSQGDNIRVAIIDTGLDPAQEQFADWKFHDDGRLIWKTHTDSDFQGYPRWQDTCNHGTRIAGVIGAPLDGIGMVGIAYKSDLITIHADDDVYMENAGDVLAAFDVAAAHGAHIVQMAFKSDKWFSGISDAIRAYYHRSPNGMLFVGAAGTSPFASTYNFNVVFPAEMTEVIAVSAINKDGSLASTSHYGPAVDLAGFVGQPSPNVPSRQMTGPVVRVRGTSAASATISGIAALVWARYPTWTNKQVRARLMSSARHPWQHNWSDGYGYVNAFKAVGGFYDLRIDGPMCADESMEEVALTAIPYGDGPFAFEWNDGITTRTGQAAVMPAPPLGETREYRVIVTDLADGQTRAAFYSVERKVLESEAETC